MFEKDDIILGLLSGLEFHTTVDFEIFRKTTKPGDIYTFRDLTPKLVQPKIEFFGF
jgi:hypothetical protein